MLQKQKKKVAAAMLTALMITGGALFAGCGNGGQQGQHAMETPVKVMQVIKRDTPVVYDFTGFVEAQQEATITAQVNGRITGKFFKGGDFVEAGQTLFTIDQRSYQQNLLSARAGVAAAKADAIRLRADKERYASLYEKNAVSKQQYDLITAQCEQAESNLAAQQAILENAEISMDDTNVKAPFSGRVDTSDISEGNYVTVGQTVLCTMSNTDPVRVKFSLSENEYLKLAQSSSAEGVRPLENLTLTLSDGSTYPIKGTVDQVDRGVTNGTGTLTLKALFQNPNRLLLPGMFTHVSANAGTAKDAMLIPQRAVKEMLFKKFVFVVNQDNKVNMKEVILGPRVGRLWQVEKGLEGNETLVVEGVQKVNEGSAVKPEAMTEKDLENTAQ